MSTIPYLALLSSNSRAKAITPEPRRDISYDFRHVKLVKLGLAACCAIHGSMCMYVLNFALCIVRVRVAELVPLVCHPLKILYWRNPMGRKYRYNIVN